MNGLKSVTARLPTEMKNSSIEIVKRTMVAVLECVSAKSTPIHLSPRRKAGEKENRMASSKKRRNCGAMAADVP